MFQLLVTACVLRETNALSSGPAVSSPGAEAASGDGEAALRACAERSLAPGPLSERWCKSCSEEGTKSVCGVQPSYHAKTYFRVFKHAHNFLRNDKAIKMFVVVVSWYISRYSFNIKSGFFFPL